MLQCESVQRGPEHVFHRRRRPQPEAPSRTAHQVRRQAHRLGAAGEHRVGFTQRDELSALHDRFESGTAEAIDRDGGRFDQETGAEADVPREIDGVGRGLHHVAEDHVPDVAGREARPVDRALRRHDAEVGRAQVLERAAERAEPGADSGKEDDHGTSGRSGAGLRHIMTTVGAEAPARIEIGATRIAGNECHGTAAGRAEIDGPVGW